MSPARRPQEPTRKQRREKARDERKAREAAERRAAASRKRLGQMAGAVLAVIAIAVILVLVVFGPGSKKGAVTTANSASTTAAQAGLLTSHAPWAPQYGGLLERVANMRLPGESDVAYHVHAALHIYIEGKQVPVPAEIGIDQPEGYLAPLHTHDTSGIIHMEAAYEYPFTLGQFFTVWGVKFASNQIGGYKTGGGDTVAVYVNGHEVVDPAKYVMKPHDLIAVDYGTPEESVKEFPFAWPAGL